MAKQTATQKNRAYLNKQIAQIQEQLGTNTSEFFKYMKEYLNISEKDFYNITKPTKHGRRLKNITDLTKQQKNKVNAMTKRQRNQKKRKFNFESQKKKNRKPNLNELKKEHELHTIQQALYTEIYDFFEDTQTVLNIEENLSKFPTEIQDTYSEIKNIYDKMQNNELHLIDKYVKENILDIWKAYKNFESYIDNWKNTQNKSKPKKFKDNLFK